MGSLVVDQGRRRSRNVLRNWAKRSLIEPQRVHNLQEEILGCVVEWRLCLWLESKVVAHHDIFILASKLESVVGSQHVYWLIGLRLMNDVGIVHHILLNVLENLVLGLRLVHIHVRIHELRVLDVHTIGLNSLVWRHIVLLILD